MHISPTPLIEAFYGLCESDKRLRSAIAHITVIPEPDGLQAIIQPLPGQVRWISRRLFKITRFLLILGNFKAITVISHLPLTFLVTDLIATCPVIGQPSEGKRDRALRQEEIASALKHAHYFRSLLSKWHAVFVLSKHCIILDVLFRDCTEAKNLPAVMIGRPLARFLDQQTAVLWLLAVCEVCLQHSTKVMEYSIQWADGEVHHYQAELLPLLGEEAAIALVNRL